MSEYTTIKALASQQKVSYQSIWKMVVKYEKELSGHIITRNKVRYLDSEAVDFIIQKRRDHPLVAMNDDQSAIIESLTREKDSLKAKIDALQEQIKARDDHIIELQKDIQNKLEYQIRNEYLLADKENLTEQVKEVKEQVNAAREETKEAKEEAKELRTELDSFERTIFGFYRKKKK